MVKRWRQIVCWIIVSILLVVFFSYKITEVPTGFTLDEAAFGYNAVLLSRTAHDQNGRFLPVFVLSLEKDWRQPVTQYYDTLFFKLFGASVFTLRFSTVFITLFSVYLLYFLTSQLMGRWQAILASTIFITTPLVMIQTHLALDNIMPIPFIIAWLIGVYLFEKKKSFKYLVLAGISLGIGFYTYKGMRASVPVWCILTVLYLVIKEKIEQGRWIAKKSIKASIVYSLAIAPFFLVIPLLEWKYAGAVFDRHGFDWSNLYNFLYPYFSSYDPSFLFIQGDTMLIHSTQKHGMMLLATLLLFIPGLFQVPKKGGFWWFILISFFTAPLLYGMVGSVHRASRLMSIIPQYALLCTLGAVWLYHAKSKIVNLRYGLFLIIVLLLVNYFDFINYYWFEYPSFTQNIFGDLSIYKDYKIFADESKRLGLNPVIFRDVHSNKEINGFIEYTYFPKELRKWEDSQGPLPSGTIIMSNREDIPGMEKLPTKLPHFILHIKR